MFLLIYLLLYYFLIWEGVLDFIWKGFGIKSREFQIPLIIGLSFYFSFNGKMKTVFWPKVEAWIEDKI
jgi:hypothetical protein